MQKGPPPLVLRRPAKADGVVLQPIPFHEKQVCARLLQASRQRQATEPRHAPDDRLGLRERHLEGLLLAWLDRQQRMLKDHGEMIAAAANVERLGSHEWAALGTQLLVRQRRAPPRSPFWWAFPSDQQGQRAPRPSSQGARRGMVRRPPGSRLLAVLLDLAFGKLLDGHWRMRRRPKNRRCVRD